jgi:hypothetical protein
MLQQIKHFFQTQPIASLAQVCDNLAVEPEFARQMLQHWVAKGRLRCLSQADQNQTSGCASGACGSCQLTACNSQVVPAELYAWQ